MASIVPTILTTDPAVYQQQLTAYSAFSKRLQIDLTDGAFTPSATLSLDQLAPAPQGIELDLHLMYLRPSEHIQKILALKPALVILHAEASENLLEVFSQLRSAGIKVGVALLKGTYPGRIRPYIEAADHVMIFAGTLGEQGGKADMLQTEKVPLIRGLKSGLEIGWDGGANLQNIRALGHSDIDVINVGSALATSQDPAVAYNELVQESQARGVAL